MLQNLVPPIQSPLYKPRLTRTYPDSKVHVAQMGPIWVLSAPGGSDAGPMNLANRGAL